MDFFYRTKRTLTGAERTIRFKMGSVSKTTLGKALGTALVTAGVTAILPVVIKHLVLVGQLLLTALQN